MAGEFYQAWQNQVIVPPELHFQLTSGPESSTDNHNRQDWKGDAQNKGSGGWCAHDGEIGSVEKYSASNLHGGYK